MIKKEFFKERDELLKDSNKVPSKDFCDMFMNRLERVLSKCPREYLGRDAEDYYSWGKVLFDYYEDAENTVQDLMIFEWVEFYELLTKGELVKAHIVLRDISDARYR